MQGRNPSSLAHSPYPSSTPTCPAKSPRFQVDPLYPLPADLFHILSEHLPDWFSPPEIAFEQELQQFCQQHQAVGIYGGRPVQDLTLHRPPTLTLSKYLNHWLGWESFWTPSKANWLMSSALERTDPLVERLDAYRGWLLTNPVFLKELKQLKSRWESATVKIGYFPRYPVQLSEDVKTKRPRDARDVSEEYAHDLRTFYDRWELDGLATWDLPQPRGANLSGIPLPASMASTSTMKSFQISSIMPLPANYPLRAMVEESQRPHSRAHLQGWLQVQQQQHPGDLRFGRFRDMFLLHFYRDTVLASRYRSRFAGHVEPLDRAFGKYLGKSSVDSIKKLRLQMDALRHRDC